SQLGHGAKTYGTQAKLAECLKQIARRKPRRPHLSSRARRVGRGNHNDKSSADTEEAESEFHGDGWIFVRELHPEPRSDRSDDEDQYRIESLKPRRRICETEDLIVCVAVREKIQRRAGLLIDRPENSRGHKQHHDRLDTPFLNGREALRGEQSRERR